MPDASQDLDIELVPASLTNARERAEIINVSYADYFVPTQLSDAQIRRMDHLYDVDLEHSVVARAGKALVGMAMLSRRGSHGWVSSVGVVPGWRRRGLARAMMSYLIATSTQEGLERLSLEVIDRNAPARALYESLGFLAKRELLGWRRSSDADALPAPDARMVSDNPRRLITSFPTWRDQPPCWQRAPATLQKMAEQLQAVRLATPGPGAYIVFSDLGDRLALLDMGMDPSGDPVRAGRNLLQGLAVRYAGRAFSIGNVSADDRLNRILAALGFVVTIRQWEMHRAV